MSGEQSSDPFPLTLNASMTGWSGGTIGDFDATSLSMDGRVWGEGFLSLNKLLGVSVDTNGTPIGLACLAYFHEMWVWGNPGGVTTLRVRNLHQVFNTAGANEVAQSHQIDTGNGVTRPHLHYVWPEDEQRIPIKFSTALKGTAPDITISVDGPPIAFWEATAPEQGTTTIQKAQYYIRMTVRSGQLVNILQSIHIPNVKNVVKRHKENDDYNIKRIKIAKVKAITMPVLNE